MEPPLSPKPADNPAQKIDPAPDTPPDPFEDQFGHLITVDGDKVKLNQPAIAAKFARHMNVRYSQNESQFNEFDGAEGIWKKITRKVAMWLVTVYLETLADTMKVPELLLKRTPALTSGILQFVEGCAPMGAPPPPSAKLMPMANGVLELLTAEPVLREYRQEDFFTYKLSVSYVPRGKCERFLNELIRPALPNPDDLFLLQRDLGRQLFAGNDAQTITILQGEGGSGKSVLISILEAIIGLSKIGYLRSNQLTGRFETHGFIGKSTLVGKDVLPDYLNNQGAAVIKSLTGADRIQTEQKYGGKHDMRGIFYVIITTNGRLTIKLHGDMKAWRRRLVVYEFSRQTPDKIIPNFDKVLLHEEGNAIFSWLVQGYLAHHEELKEHGTLKLTPTQQQRVDDWLEEGDALRVFAKASIQKGVGTITVAEIWDSFIAFAGKRNWRMFGEQKFHEDFKAVMLELFGVAKSNHIRRLGVEVRGYRGVQFIKEEVQP
jgi:P4 family phage/plasmid primase-like protien